MAEMTMSWTKAKDYLAALRDVEGTMLTELQGSSLSLRELIDWAQAWYLVALEARRIAVMLENERKRRLRRHSDHTD